MKQCIFCDRQVADGAMTCDCGRSQFISPRKKTRYISKEESKVADYLKRSGIVASHDVEDGARAVYQYLNSNDIDITREVVIKLLVEQNKRGDGFFPAAHVFKASLKPPEHETPKAKESNQQIFYSFKKFTKTDIKQAYEQAKDIVLVCNDALIQKIRKAPSILYELNWRIFEEIIAEILYKRGWEVELTPKSNDGGYDIIAIRFREGPEKILVECKFYRPDRKVGVGLVRQLYGVTEHEKATRGVMVTTSYYTRPAQEFEEEHQFRLLLQDYNNLASWLKEGWQQQNA